MGIDPNKPLWQLTVGEFLELQQSVEVPTKEKPEEKQEEYLTPMQTASLLNVAKTTLWRWQKRNYLTPIKVGGLLRYRKSDIDKLQQSKP